MLELFRTVRVGRLLLRGMLAVFACLLLLAALIAALPTIVSTPFAQRHLRQTLTASLKRTVTWAHMDLSWSRGVLLRSLALGTGPAPLLTASVGDLAIVPSFAYRDGRVRVDLDLRVSSVAADLAPGPPNPPKP